MSFCCAFYFMYVLILSSFHDPSSSCIYTLSLHDALPIWAAHGLPWAARSFSGRTAICVEGPRSCPRRLDRKSTRLNSSHLGISYAVFCLKKKIYKCSCGLAMQSNVYIYNIYILQRYVYDV